MSPMSTQGAVRASLRHDPLTDDEARAADTESREEVELWRGKPRTFGDIPTTVGGLLLAMLLSGGLQQILPRDRYDMPWLDHLPTWVFGLIVLATVGHLLNDWIRNQSTRYTLTSERLIVRRGLFSITTDDLELFRVRDMQVELPFHLRIFGLGSIVLVTADAMTPIIRIEAQGDAEALRDLLRAHVYARQTARGYREIEVT